MTISIEADNGITVAIKELAKDIFNAEPLSASTTKEHYQFKNDIILKGDDRLQHFVIPLDFDIKRLNGPEIKLKREEYIEMRYSFYAQKSVKHVLDPNLHLQWTSSPDEKVNISLIEPSNNPKYPNWFIIKKD